MREPISILVILTLMLMQHAMYFGFCEWRHVFTKQSECAKSGVRFIEFARWRHWGQSLPPLQLHLVANWLLLMLISKRLIEKLVSSNLQPHALI